MYSILSQVNLENDMLNNVLSFNNKTDEEYLEEWKVKMYQVMYNFYWDIFQDRKMLNSKVLNKRVEGPTNCWMNVIAEGARGMEEICKRKNDRKRFNHIIDSMYVS